MSHLRGGVAQPCAMLLWWTNCCWLPGLLQWTKAGQPLLQLAESSAWRWVGRQGKQLHANISPSTLYIQSDSFTPKHPPLQIYLAVGAGVECCFLAVARTL